MRAVSDIAKAVRPRSWFAKTSTGVVLAYLLLKGIRVLLAPPQWLVTLVNVALFIVLVRYAFKFMRWASRRLLWRLRRRLIVTYLLVGVVPVILLFSILVILGYAFFGQLVSYFESTELSRLSSKLETANRSIAGPMLDSLATQPSVVATWDKQFSPLFQDLGSSFSHVWIDAEDGTSHVALDLENGRLTERPQKVAKPAWIKSDTTGLFEEQSKVLFACLVNKGGVEGRSWVLLRAPLDSSVLRRFSERYQVSISILTLVPLSAESGNASTQVTVGDKQASIRVTLGDKLFIQRDMRQVDPASAAEYTQRLTWYDFWTRAIFFLPNVRVWQTGKPLESIQWMYFLDSTWLRLAKRFFSQGTLGEENIIVYVLVAVSVVFLVIEFVALLSSLLMTRTITGAVHNLDQGAQHIMRGDFSHRIRVKPRDQLSSLGETFNTMTASIERLLKEQVEKQRLESELAIALEVQKQLFPRESPQLRTLQVAGVCNPARIVSGDYYDYIMIEPTTVGLALGDVSGKGVSAALLMASLQAALRSHSYFLGNRSFAMANGGVAGSVTAVATSTISNSVAGIVSLLNKQLYQNSPSEKYVTFFYGVYDEWRRLFTYTNAGHLPPLVFSNKKVNRLETGGTVLGLIRDAEYRQDEVNFSPKDVLVAYTDGITEAANSFDEEFGERRLIQVVERSIERPPEEILDAILGSVQDWVGVGEPQDDMTLIVAKAT